MGRIPHRMCPFQLGSHKSNRDVVWGAESCQHKDRCVLTEQIVYKTKTYTHRLQKSTTLNCTLLCASSSAFFFARSSSRESGTRFVFVSLTSSSSSASLFDALLTSNSRQNFLYYTMWLPQLYQQKFKHRYINIENHFDWNFIKSFSKIYKVWRLAEYYFTGHMYLLMSNKLYQNMETITDNWQLPSTSIIII